ncbi:hypothetical protein [Paenarthrobacter sp. YIM B13468]|uniref:hypothetical protein n=1 Tax=Paenarthrobacter sp. YIM B13468 TaxID=3366295 RepID=UPI00366FB363
MPQKHDKGQQKRQRRERRAQELENQQESPLSLAIQLVERGLCNDHILGNLKRRPYFESERR